MDKDTERALKSFHRRLNTIEEKVSANSEVVDKIARDIARFYHLGLGLAVGLVARELGLENIIGRFL